MTTFVFDTHKAVKALRQAGADEPLAEAVVATIGEAMHENLATKADIGDVRTELAAVKTELKADIAGLEARLYRQLWVMAAGIVGLTVTLVKLLA